MSFRTYGEGRGDLENAREAARERGVHVQRAGERGILPGWVAQGAESSARNVTENMSPMFVTREVSQLQRLIEGRRALVPRVAGRAHGVGRAAGREAGGGARARRARAACRGKGDTARLGGTGRGEQCT